MKYYFVALGTLVVICVGCAVDGQQHLPRNEHYAPPAAMLQHPGPMVDGPGPGVMPPLAPPPAPAFSTLTSQVRFVGPAGMHVGWLIPGGYAENQVVTPGRYNFRQGATYRLKLTEVPNRAGLVLYPTLQVHHALPMTDAYLSHNSVPIEITDEDLDQVENNNFVTKVIYLPDPRFQELAIAGVETIVSTKLDPGVDPIAEAQRRGSIMAVLRLGNMDLQMPGVGPGVIGAGIPGTDGIQQASFEAADGAQGQFAPPLPIAFMGRNIHGVPGPQIVGGSSLPGMPAMNPVSGMGPVAKWGDPITATPIGLPGPPSLPYGGPAGLQSYTMRNLTDVKLPKPVAHMQVDVKHEPGISLPDPVNYIRYEEKHPDLSPGEAAYPKWSIPNAEGRP